jgi:outer membrane protein OmpA-like peptidoglycan-associated protein
MPTFAEAAEVEKTLIADRDKAGEPSPASPSPADAPRADAPIRADGRPQVTVRPLAQRAEDQAPCLNHAVDGAATATVRFDQGSSALSADAIEVIAEALPAVREKSGAIRILGHGDTEVGAAQAAQRFDLAVARAGAVAQALTGFGIPAPRIAVGVACTDPAVAGASVQLYAES